jgi:hypothetical protein
MWLNRFVTYVGESYRQALLVPFLVIEKRDSPGGRNQKHHQSSAISWTQILQQHLTQTEPMHLPLQVPGDALDSELAWCRWALLRSAPAYGFGGAR